MSIVACDDAEVTFGATTALSRTSLHVARAESVAIMGPSGSGKTTLLQCIEGLVTATSGEVWVLGQNQTSSSGRKRSDLRRVKMGLIFQTADLLPEFNTAENVAFTLLFDGVPRTKAIGAARNALRAVGLGDRENADIRTLSGGEAQRVAVARALARPTVELIIADEPTASLDVENARDITELLLVHARERGAAVLLATHDPAIAAMCDRIVQIERHGSTS